MENKPHNGNIFARIPAHIPDEVFETIVGDDPVKIERIISCGHATPEGHWYDQDRNEWVMVLQGRADILFEGDREAITLTPGDHVHIAAHRRHRVTRTDDKQPTIWLAVHYP